MELRFCLDALMTEVVRKIQHRKNGAAFVVIKKVISDYNYKFIVAVFPDSVMKYLFKMI